jgi:hypothetical protein
MPMNIHIRLYSTYLFVLSLMYVCICPDDIVENIFTPIPYGLPEFFPRERMDSQ